MPHKSEIHKRFNLENRIAIMNFIDDLRKLEIQDEVLTDYKLAYIKDLEEIIIKYQRIYLADDGGIPAAVGEYIYKIVSSHGHIFSAPKYLVFDKISMVFYRNISGNELPYEIFEDHIKEMVSLEIQLQETMFLAELELLSQEKK